MGLNIQGFDEALRNARNAEFAHLEAILKQADSKVLRLADLQDKIRVGLGRHAENMGFLELKHAAGDEPQLWLDLVHAVSMEPDATTFRLSRYHLNERETLFESQTVADIAAQSLRHMAHEVIKDARFAAAHTGKPDEKTIAGWSAITLLYVWLTGFVVGVAVLTLLSIYLKNINF